MPDLEPTTKPRFAELLREHRKSSGLSNKTELANAIGISQSYVSVLENPKDPRLPQRHLVHSIADYFKLSLTKRNELLVAAGHLAAEAATEFDQDLLSFIRKAPANSREADLLVRELKSYALRWMRQRRARERAVRKVVILAAGWQASLLAPENLEVIIRHAAEEARNAQIRQLIVVVAPTKVAPNFRSLSKIVSSVKTTVQDEPLGLGHALLQARPYVEEEPFAVILPTDVDPTRLAIGQMKDVYTRIQKPMLAINPLNNKLRADLHLSGHVSLDRPVDGYPRLSYAGEMYEKEINHPMPRDQRPIVGRYILTPDIFTFLEATPKNTRTKKIELTDALEDFRKSHHFVCAYELETALLPLAPVRALVETLLKSISSTDKLKEMIEVAQNALGRAEKITNS